MVDINMTQQIRRCISELIDIHVERTLDGNDYDWAEFLVYRDLWKAGALTRRETYRFPWANYVRYEFFYGERYVGDALYS